VASDKSFFFSVTVPEGNYHVTAVLGDPNGACTTTIKAESRRLMVEKAETEAGKTRSVDFIVNVRNFKVPAPPLNAPGGDQVRLNDREAGVLHWDDKLTLEFGNKRPCLDALKIERVTGIPTVFIAGDSTVTDQPGEPTTSWGQMLTRFLKPDVAVANHAESGETLKSFITGLRMDKILSQIQPGDYLFMQFGHNDMKANWPQTYVEPFTTHKAYLKVFIAEARRHGAIPVLVTPMQRRNFVDGKIRNSLGDFPESVRQTAAEEKVALIDLTKMSIAFYEALGPDKAPLAFSGGRDATHHSSYGAYELAKCIVEGIRANNLPLAKSIVSDYKTFVPAHPDNPDTYDVPASPRRQTAAPRGN
jgi:lysophospholipase L1-like esterase